MINSQQFPLEIFEKSSQGFDEIATQNARFDTANVIFGNEPELGDEVKASITGEQASTFENLTNPDNLPPLEEVFGVYNELSEELETTLERIKNITDIEDAQKTALIALAKKARELAPLATDRINQIEVSRIDAITSLNRLGLQQRVDQIEESLTHLQLLIEMDNITAWPIPRAFNPAEATVVTEGITTRYEMPVEPILSEHPTRDVENSPSREIEAPEASDDIAAYLRAHRGKIITVEDLAGSVYGANTTTPRTVLRTRVTTTLGPAVKGALIKRLLAEDAQEPLGLEYGWLHKHDPETNQTVRHRIYRARPLAEIEPNAKMFHVNEDELDSMQPEVHSTNQENSIAPSDSEQVVQQPVEISVEVVEAAPMLQDGPRAKINRMIARLVVEGVIGAEFNTKDFDGTRVVAMATPNGPRSVQGDPHLKPKTSEIIEHALTEYYEEDRKSA